MKSRHLTGIVVATTTVASSWFATHQVGASQQNLGNDADKNPTNAKPVRTQAVGSLCSPIVGTGKSTGVPIAVEGSDGQLLTDITGLTFELDNGAGTTQDVTSEIKTAAEQPLVVNQDEGGNLTELLQVRFNQPSLDVATPSTAVGINYDNPGYYFLSCLPSTTDVTVKFPAGTTLRAKSDGVVVASGSVAGRGGATLMISAGTGEPDYYGFAPISNAAIHSVIRPVSGDHTSLSTLYQGYLDRVGIPFTSTFASVAILNLSNDPDTTAAPYPYCWDDLLTIDEVNDRWSWNTNGNAFLSELMTQNAGSRPILTNRTIGATHASDPVMQGLCDVSDADVEDDFFMNYLAAQLLLIDAPAGRVPASLLNANVSALNGETETYLKPAVRLISTTPSSPTTTTPSTTIAPTTTVSKVQKLTRLPSTGNDAVPSGLMAIGAIALGSVVVVATRRRVVSQK